MVAVGERRGSTISSAFIVFRALTTRAAGKARWICSPSESVLQTVSEGGMPREKSRGLAMSKRTLPSRFGPPACSASSEVAPEVALTTQLAVRGGLGEGAEPELGVLLAPDVERRVAVLVGFVACQGRRRIARADHHLVAEPASRAAMVCPTMPVPRTPMFMPASSMPSSEIPPVAGRSPSRRVR